MRPESQHQSGKVGDSDTNRIGANLSIQDLQGCRPDKQGVNAALTHQRRELLVMTFIGFVIGFFLLFAYSSYLGRGGFDQLFLFPALDTPPVPGTFYSGPLGVHTFGDFLQPMWQAGLSPSPFQAGYSSYLPAANGLFWILSYFPYWIAFLVVFAGSIGAISRAFFSVWAGCATSQKLRMLCGGVLCTYPTLVALDRGNIQLLAIGFLLISISSSNEDSEISAGAWLGLAIALKAYPALFAVLLIRRRQWKALLTAAMSAGVLTIVSLSMFAGGFNTNVKALVSNLAGSQTELGSLALYSNNSLKALVMSLKHHHMNSTLVGILSHDRVLAALCLLLLILISLWKWSTELEITLVIAAISTLFIGFSAGYVLLVFFVPILLMNARSVGLNKGWARTYALLLALILMPKQIPLNLMAGGAVPNVPSLGSVVNPLLMLLGLVLVAARGAVATLTSSARGGT